MVRFEELRRNAGVDSVQLGREWMMVPYRGENLVRLTNGSGFEVAVANGGSRVAVKEALAKDWPRLLGRLGAMLFTKDDRLFQVTGKQPGVATLRAKKGTVHTTLAVSVHKKLSLTVAFFFLQDRDAQGHAQSRTKFAPADADAWIDSLNHVFEPQANIRFKKVKADFLPLSDLSAVVSADDAEKLARKKEAGAKINIFLAGPDIRGSSPGHSNGFFHIAHKLIILKDREEDAWGPMAAPMLQTMAHEIGHLLNHTRGGSAGHEFFRTNGYNSDIMNTITGNDIKISKQRVVAWNPP